jgi:hypothetical protein
MPHSSYLVRDPENTNYPLVYISSLPILHGGKVVGRNDGTGIQYKTNYPRARSEVFLNPDDPNLGDGGGGGGAVTIYIIPAD